MNWYKEAKDFSDRNLINNKIKYLTEIKNTITVLSKLVFQSGKNTKNASYRIVSSDKITSYPALHDILIEADSLVLDSPWRFAVLCKKAVEKIDNLIFSLKEERKEITYGDQTKRPQKGWI